MKWNGKEISKNTIEKFLEKVKKSDDGCWLWMGCIDKGYGKTCANGKQISAHRLSWLCHNGEIPEGMGVLHKCDVKNCVNPEHFFLGTNKENVEDKVLKGRHFKKVFLPNEKVDEIRKLYIRGGTGSRKFRNEFSQESLARKYGVGKTEVNRIVNDPTYYPLEEKKMRWMEQTMFIQKDSNGVIVRCEENKPDTYKSTIEKAYRSTDEPGKQITEYAKKKQAEKRKWMGD